MNIKVHKSELIIQTCLYSYGIFTLLKYSPFISKLVFIDGVVCFGIYSYMIKKKYNLSNFTFKMTFGFGIIFSVGVSFGLLVGSYFCIYKMGRCIIRNVVIFLKN